MRKKVPINCAAPPSGTLGPTKRKRTSGERPIPNLAEAHAELTQPELSKGRPPADDGSKGQRPSNAGRDGS